MYFLRTLAILLWIILFCNIVHIWVCFLGSSVNIIIVRKLLQIKFVNVGWWNNISADVINAIYKFSIFYVFIWEIIGRFCLCFIWLSFETVFILYVLPPWHRFRVFSLTYAAMSLTGNFWLDFARLLTVGYKLTLEFSFSLTVDSLLKLLSQFLLETMLFFAILFSVCLVLEGIG